MFDYFQNESPTPSAEPKSKEQLILDRIKAEEEKKKQQQQSIFDADKKRWGECYSLYQYDWMGWKKSANGTWVTDYRGCWSRPYFSKPEIRGSISVTCKGLKLSELSKIYGGWSKWRDPYDSEKPMIAKICAREL